MQSLTRCIVIFRNFDALQEFQFEVWHVMKYKVQNVTTWRISNRISDTLQNFISKSDTSLSFHFKIWHMVEFLIHNGTHCGKLNSESSFSKKKQKMPKILFSCIKAAEKCSFSVQIICHLPICLKLLNSQSELRGNFKNQIWRVVKLSNQN